MIRKILVIMTVVGSIVDSTEGSPHHHDDDPYGRVIRLLQEARKEHKNGGGSRFDRVTASQNSDYHFAQLPIVSNRPSGGSSGTRRDSPPNPILTPGSGSNSGGGSGNFGTVGSSISNLFPVSPSNNRPNLPNFPGSQIIDQFPTRPPYPISQVNQGVSTILNGVRSFDLGQILRGAFIFPRNENVKSVANNVIDTIFGQARQSP